MKKHNAQKLSILLFLLICLLPVLAYLAMFSSTSFNWFSIPKPQELYLESYDTSASQYVNFVVHSSTSSNCMLSYCSNEANVSLKSGINSFQEPIRACGSSFWIILQCPQSTVSFHCTKTSSPQELESYNLSFVARVGNGLVDLEIQPEVFLNSSGYRAITILLDNNEVGKPSYFFPQGASSQRFEYSINAEPGTHVISVQLGTSSSEQTVEVNAPHYPYSLLAALMASVALGVLISLNSELDFIYSLLVTFASASSAIVLQFQFVSLGLNEWIIPVILLAVLVLVWKKMQ